MCRMLGKKGSQAAHAVCCPCDTHGSRGGGAVHVTEGIWAACIVEMARMEHWAQHSKRELDYTFGKLSFIWQSEDLGTRLLGAQAPHLRPALQIALGCQENG